MFKSAPQELQNFPEELLIEILSFCCATSAEIYRSLLLVSKQFHRLVKLPCLQVVPVVLKNYQQLSSFGYLLESSPDARDHVRYLWIMAEDHICWSLIESILASCTHVVSLACASESLIKLCAITPFRHTSCTELALIESWHTWAEITQTSHGPALCAQLTRLRLSEGLTPEFPRHHFPRLTHLAFSSRPIEDFLERHLETLKPLPRLQHIVVTTHAWRDGAPPAASSVLDLDRRLAILQCRRNWMELETWMDGVRGGFSIWEQARLERKSMEVFRDALKALRMRQP